MERDVFIKQAIHDARKALNEWEDELKSNSIDLHKFFKKRNRRAGVRYRKALKEIADKIKKLRREIVEIYR